HHRALHSFPTRRSSDLGGGQRGAAGANAGAPAAAPAPTPAPDAGPPAATFGNAGAGFKDGLPYQPWAADLVKKRQADNSKDNPRSEEHTSELQLLAYLV